MTGLWTSGYARLAVLTAFAALVAYVLGEAIPFADPIPAAITAAVATQGDLPPRGQGDGLPDPRRPPGCSDRPRDRLDHRVERRRHLPARPAVLRPGPRAAPGVGRRVAVRRREHGGHGDPRRRHAPHVRGRRRALRRRGDRRAVRPRRVGHRRADEGHARPHRRHRRPAGRRLRPALADGQGTARGAGSRAGRGAARRRPSSCATGRSASRPAGRTSPATRSGVRASIPTSWPGSSSSSTPPASCRRACCRSRPT